MTLGGPAPTARIVVIVPAHNEEALIGSALKSLAGQTRPADEVIVVADRCTDRTGEIAVANGATLVETVGNRHHKAGAIDQVLDDLLPTLSEHDAVLVMDADSQLAPEFIAEAALRLHTPEVDGPPIGGVGGIFFGTPPVEGLLGHLQSNEYVRYAREIGRRKGRADVLTGTGGLFSVRALRDVKRARSCGELPPGLGVYDVEALTEDNELTLALKHLGYRCVSPKACTVDTRLPPTASQLFHQRLRWQRGALENLLAYGVTGATVPYLGRQLMIYLGVAFVPFYLTVLFYTLLTSGYVAFPLFWNLVAAVFVIERAWSVKRGGWRSICLSALILPEVAYDLFLHGVYIKAAIDTARGSRETWASTAQPGSPAARKRNRRRNRLVTVAYGGIGVAAFVGVALALVALREAWAVVAVLVLAWAAQACLRLTGLDPLGFALGSGENVERESAPIRSRPEGPGTFPEIAGWNRRTEHGRMAPSSHRRNRREIS